MKDRKREREQENKQLWVIVVQVHEFLCWCVACVRVCEGLVK